VTVYVLWTPSAVWIAPGVTAADAADQMLRAMGPDHEHRRFLEDGAYRRNLVGTPNAVRVVRTFAASDLAYY